MPRLGHKKSRLGCRQCKARHVKCDELKPCSNCSRHGVPCSLVAWDSNTPQPPTAQAASSAAAAHRRTNQSERPIAGSSSSSTPPARLDAQTTQRTTLSEASSPESPPDQYPFLSRFIQKREPSPANLWLRDLELLHHWAIEAYPDFTGRPPIQQIWQVDIPKYAVSHAYLMHEVLAFSAFHKAHNAQDPETRREYYTFGIHHQDCAIRGVRENIPKIIPDHAIGIVACSTLLTISVFASSGLEAEMTLSPGAIDGLINNFQLIQGMGNVLALAHTIVQDSFLMPMYHDSPIVTPPQPLLAEFLHHIPNLIALIQSRHDLSEEERTVYMTTVESFSPVLAISMPPKLDNREIRFLFYWPLHLDSRFINFVRLRKQPAIAILMHYAVIFLAGEHNFWFLKGWGPRVMNECYEILDQSWLPAVQWPLTFLNPDSTWRAFPHISERQDSVRSAEDVYPHQPQVQIPHRDTPPGQSASRESAEGSSPPQKFQFHYIGPEQRPVIGITSVNTNPHPVADKD